MKGNSSETRRVLFVERAPDVAVVDSQPFRSVVLVVDKIQSKQAVISARLNWLNGGPIGIHSLKLRCLHAREATMPGATCPLVSAHIFAQLIICELSFIHCWSDQLNLALR